MFVAQFLLSFQMDSQTQYDSLYNEMKDLLAEKIPDYDKVKKCGENFFKIKRSFPADLRFRIWEVLLDISECVCCFC